MENRFFDAYNILKLLAEQLKSANRRIYTTRPKLSPDKLNDFIVVSLPVTMRDYNAYGYTTCRIELYARDTKDGYENLEKLNEMKNKVMSLFPIRNGLFSGTEPQLLLSGSDSYNFHCWVIQATIYIK